MEEREYRLCTRSVMDTSDPDIWFDDRGVSSHALHFDSYIYPVLKAAESGERKDELDQLVSNIKREGKGKPYDCIIGVSGGVDSTYLLLQSKKLGLRPLAVHFDSGWNSELATANIQNAVDTLDVDLYTQVVDWREMRDLQLAFFKASVPNLDIPTDHAFPAVAYEQAVKYGVRYNLSGSNLATESILPKAWGYNHSDRRHIRAIHKRFGSVPLKSYPLLGMVKRYGWYEKVKGIRTVKLLNYMPYIYTEAKEEIAREVGWQDYGGKHYESVFTRYFQGYYLPTKFGFDKRRAHLSSLVLAGQMSRDEALADLEAPNYDESLRLQDHDFIAKKLGISSQELNEIIEKPPVSHLDYPNNKAMWDFAMKVLRRGNPKSVPR